MLESKQVLEWQAEAAIRTKREDVLELLQFRFLAPLPEDLVRTLQGITNMEQLRRWFKVAATAPSLDTFRLTVQNGAQ